MLSVATATRTRARAGDAVMPTLCGSGTKRARGQRSVTGYVTSGFGWVRSAASSSTSAGAR